MSVVAGNQEETPIRRASSWFPALDAHVTPILVTDNTFQAGFPLPWTHGCPFCPPPIGINPKVEQTAPLATWNESGDQSAWPEIPGEPGGRSGRERRRRPATPSASDKRPGPAGRFRGGRPIHRGHLSYTARYMTRPAGRTWPPGPFPVPEPDDPLLRAAVASVTRAGTARAPLVGRRSPPAGAGAHGPPEPRRPGGFRAGAAAAAHVAAPETRARRATLRGIRGGTGQRGTGRWRTPARQRPHLRRRFLSGWGWL